jgi:glycosyltransferase involved in cell wall biosynthesis
VLAVDAGGVQETVINGTTGVLVPKEGGAVAMAEAMRETDWTAFDSARIREHAQTFSEDRFKERLVEHVAKLAPGISRTGPAT